MTFLSLPIELFTPWGKPSPIAHGIGLQMAEVRTNHVAAHR